MPSSLGGASEFVDESNFQMFPFLKQNGGKSCYLFIMIVLKRDHTWECSEFGRLLKVYPIKDKKCHWWRGEEGKENHTHFCVVILEQVVMIIL